MNEISRLIGDFIFDSGNAAVGCPLNCPNCIAIPTCNKIGHRWDSPACKIFLSALTKDESGILRWNNKVFYNPYWADDISKNPRSIYKMVILSYLGEIGELSIDELYKVCLKILDRPKHLFIFLSRIPKTLDNKLIKVNNRLLKNGLSLTMHNNVIMGTSIESNIQKNKISLLKSCTSIERKWLFCKPLKGLLNNVDYSGIECVTINRELGVPIKKLDNDLEKWILTILKEASSYNVKCHFDAHESDLKKLIEKKLLTIEGVCEMFSIVNKTTY